MAGDWLKVRCDLPDDPAVFSIAGTIGLDRDAVVGKLIRVWAWANRQSRDGVIQTSTCNALHSVTVTPCNAGVTLVDHFAGVTGFGEAMVSVGWLEVGEDSLRFPKFERYNAQSAKERALTADRVRRHRARQKADKDTNGVEDPVTPVTRYTVTREEKRRDTLFESIAPSPAEPASEPPPAMVMPCIAGKKGRPTEYPLREEKIAEYRTSFPGVDVDAELRKARQWLADNPTRRKTFDGIPAFLGRWLGRAQDQGGRREPSLPWQEESGHEPTSEEKLEQQRQRLQDHNKKRSLRQNT